MNKSCVIIISLFLLVNTSCSHKTTEGALTKTEANKWFKKKEYLNGLQAEPHPSVNKSEFARQYTANKDLWDKAFTYLRNNDLKTLPVGKYTIVADKVTVSVTEDSTKNFDKTNWESHKKFIDIQYIVSGEEKIGVAPVSTANVIKPYDEKRDVANYEAEGKYYVSTPDKFFIFFPGDAHRPNITTGDNPPDKKIVIKLLAITD
ncbi:MAG: YhcH/YjgK/YiaL family protein [Segetibacter sp.]|nr:YhcH/YjgK/YiaL family protein [Segetibacter sp.]